ncbi:MAG: nitroreductase family protein, partial [Pseudomonadota bacterium]
QTLSAGAACAAVLNGALAQGWGANWITGWMAYDRPFLEELGLKPQEFVAGYIHMGTISKAPSERRRATPEDVTSWVSG